MLTGRQDRQNVPVCLQGSGDLRAIMFMEPPGTTKAGGSEQEAGDLELDSLGVDHN